MLFYSASNALTGDGLNEGVEWLSDQLETLQLAAA